MPETQVSPVAVYSSKPTVRIDEEEHSEINTLTVGMEITESEGGVCSAELRLSNVLSDAKGATLAFDDPSIVALGSTMAIYGGDELAPQEIFRGIVTGLEADFPQDAPPELVVLAEDAFQQARMTCRTAVHEDVSVADLANALASQLSLTAVVTAFTDPVGTWVQLNESDLAFLRRIIARHDGDMQVVGDELHVSPRGEVQRGVLEMALHSQLLRARVLVDLAHQVTQMTVAGWDAVQGERVTGTTSAPGQNILPGQGSTGAEILSSTIGDRNHHVGHLMATTSDEAQALADAAFDHRARRFVCIDGTAEGNPKVRVGTHVALSGLGARLDNTYYVVRACHRWDAERGYETDFTAESAYLGGA